jgi:hypothetical protein
MVPLGSLQHFLRGRGTGALRNCCCISEVLRSKNQIRKVLVKKLIQSYSNWVPISPTEVESEPNLNAKSGLHNRDGLRSDPTEIGGSLQIDSGRSGYAGCTMADSDGWGLQQIRCRSDSLSIVRMFIGSSGNPLLRAN